jgi:hypothetical protein
MSNSKLSLTLAFLILIISQPAALTAQTIERPSSRPSATALKVTEAPVIDGVLEERAWSEAIPLTDFTQAEPFEGSPASERTEVRLLYDSTALFVGVTLHDSDPSQIVTTDTSRDAGLGEQDSFQLIFDTFHDLQNGFVFGTNVTGIQYDAQVRSQGGANSNWDASWEVKTATSADGWTAEFRIPLRTLRYGPPPQVWGVNFMRNIQRRRERTFWAPLARIYNLGRLSSAGELRGLELAAPRNFKILPYAVTSANRNFTPGAETDYDGDVGFDAKFGVTGSLNLDVTYNTDFAQVEVDTQQINLTRFNVRFPEKRPFFLENADLFNVGKGQDLDLFFSRRIGISNDGSLVPITGGARLSGKVAGLNVGALNIQTEEVDLERRPANNFTTLRMSRDLPSRSGIGAIFVNRSAVGEFAGTNNWNRTYGMDARMGIGERFSVSGFAAKTDTPGRTGREWAHNIDTEYDNGKTRLFFEHGITGEAFNPEAGFLRTLGGYRRTSMGFYETARQTWIRDMGFREFAPHMSYTRYDYLDGKGMRNAEMHIDNHFDWENGFFISPALNVTWEGLDRPFEVYPNVVVPAGQYASPRLTLRVNSDRRKAMFGRIQWDMGGFLSGTQRTYLQQLILRQGGRFAVDTTWTRTDIELPQGAFKTDLANMRMTYNFTPTVFTQSLIQYNSRTNRMSMNLRFHWLSTAGTGLFVVYNDTESTNGNGPVNRALIIKYVKQFDILR